MSANKEDKGFPYFNFMILLAGLALMILGGQSLRDKIQSKPTRITTVQPGNAVPEPAAVSGTPEPITIEHDIIDVECGSDGKVLNARISLAFAGGVAPYQVEFDSGDIVADVKAGSRVEFTLEGGGSLTVMVKSGTEDGNPARSRNIHAPATDDSCNELTSTGTPTTESTNTADPGTIPTATPTPTSAIHVVTVPVSEVSVATRPSITPTVKASTPLPPPSITPSEHIKPSNTPKPVTVRVTHTPKPVEVRATHTPKEPKATRTSKPHDKPTHTPKP